MEGFTVLDYPSHVTEAIEAWGRWQRTLADFARRHADKFRY
jgi:hypothetical protein